MLLQIIVDALFLFILGLLGWFLLGKLRVPAPEILGPAALIGFLRVLQVDLPLSPVFIFPAVQVIIGIFVGSMLNRDAVRELKTMAMAVVVIIIWALSIVFILGFLLARYTAIDLYTAMLSASMGGLPEITIIAIASGAGIAVIVATQMLRMLGSIFIFPIILSRIEARDRKAVRAAAGANRENQFSAIGEKAVPDPDVAGDPGSALPERAKGASPSESVSAAWKKGRGWQQYFSRPCFKAQLQSTGASWKRVIFTLAAASTGGIIFNTIGVPAGLLVGSTVFVAVLSVTGIKVSRLSPRLFNLLLVFIGINIADHISAGTFVTIGTPALMFPILLITLITFVTSFGMSALIFRMTGWDYPTCFLATAPGGFTMMTALAVRHGLDPFRVSMLHLCRLLAINISLPFIFMLLMSR